MTIIKKFTSPALPLPAQIYDVMSENEKSRVFRLYFNLLDKYLNDLTTIMNGGGPGLGIVLPHIAASDYNRSKNYSNDTANRG
jgi:hypothetical protein